jgi:hypothetical protein
MMMGDWMTYMVANVASTQALTNPLLARNVFNDTLTKRGEESPKTPAHCPPLWPQCCRSRRGPRQLYLST